MSDEWTKNQEERFAKDSVIDEAYRNPIQKQRIDVAVNMIGGPGLKVLDVGCGNGFISELIHKNGNECWGMDLPAVQDTVPDERRKWLNVSPGDASQSPWFYELKIEPTDRKVHPTDENPIWEQKKLRCTDYDGFFDVVFAGEIIEHMLDLEPFLSEAFRVLKPGGRLVLTTPNIVRALNRVAMLFGQVHVWHEWQHIPHHCRFFTPQTLQEAVAKYGFKPLRLGSGMSQAEGTSLGFETSWLDELSSEERRVLLNLLERATPDPVWRHSFIVLESRKPGGET